MIKLKDLLFEGRENELDHLSKMPLNKLRNSRAAVANRMTARWYGMDAHDYLTMHDDELKKRGEVNEGQLNEANPRREAWDFLQGVKLDLRSSYAKVKDTSKRFPLKRSQVALGHSATKKIAEAEQWVDKLMKDIANG